MTQYVLSLSYGKDSMACIHVIKDILKWQLDRIITVDVWFDEETPADLPEVWEFKKQMDEVIKQRYDIEVEHLCAMRDGIPQTYFNIFYRTISNTQSKIRKQRYGTEEQFYGFPIQKGAWCNSRLKVDVQNVLGGCVQYLGIANDEPIRIARHINKPNILLPLVEAGWDEDMCGLWCKYSGMLSPTYSHSYRDGCWFCHNQGVDQLRYLRKNYRYLWDKLLALDDDSPVTFHADGRTVHDFDRRFQLEDEGYVQTGKKFRWAEVENAQMNIMQFIGG